MAQHIKVILTCDVHDEEAQAVETVLFRLGNVAYECDVCEKHLAEFRQTIGIWFTHARPLGQDRGEASASQPSQAVRRSHARPRRRGEGPPPPAVREWARVHGIPVDPRGPLPPELCAAFDAAHPGSYRLDQ